MIYEEIGSNVRKSYLLMFVFLGIIILLGYLIGAFFKMPYFGLAIAFIISFIFILFSYFSGDKVVLALNKAKEANKKEHAYLINTVEGLAIAAGISKPKIYVVNDPSINAFAVGRDPKHASVAVTTGALKKLNRQELEGVVAHELSHVKNYDIRMMMLAVMLAGIVVVLADFMVRSFIWGRGRDDDRGGIGIILLVVGLVFAILAPIFAELIKLAISRRREYLADASGALLTRYPPGLASALKKIQKDNEPATVTANQATASLYIANPFKNTKGLFINLFSTHPPIEDRIKRLDAM